MVLTTALIGPGPASASPRRPGPAAAATAGPAVPRGASTERAALATAAAVDERVEVTSLRSETTQVFAEPDGNLTAESAAVPQRVRRAGGDWAPVDLSLKSFPDGTLRPGASVADVRFSGGGTGPLVTVVRGGKTMTLSWPSVLPAPAVQGGVATYSGVLPDVDLVVRATDTGFAHVLVVKTPRAAADLQVRQLRYRVGGDVHMVNDPSGGGLQALVGRTVLASAQQPVMWDSTVRPPAGLTTIRRATF